MMPLIGCSCRWNQMRHMKAFGPSPARGCLFRPCRLHQVWNVTSTADYVEGIVTGFSLVISVTGVYLAASDSLGSFPSDDGLTCLMSFMCCLWHFIRGGGCPLSKWWRLMEDGKQMQPSVGLCWQEHLCGPGCVWVRASSIVKAYVCG